MHCPGCGAANSDGTVVCAECGGVMPRPAPPSGMDPRSMRGILPVNTSPWAMAAGYLGLFSLLVVFAPFAVVCGVMGLRQIRRNPGMFGSVRSWFGIVMGVAVMGVLAAALISAM